MPRKKTGYGSSCYYAGKLMGRCTVADGEAYTALMEQCGGDAAHVLRNYAYFSPELKGILEKVAAIQASKSRVASPPGLFVEPKISPWGKIQTCDVLCPGVFMVSTESHGGTMVAKEVSAFLSLAAQKCGFKQGGYLCYEEDSQESVVFRELLDKRLWKIPERIKDKAAFEENINQSLRKYNPAYWRARERGREAARPVVRQDAARNEVR